MRRASERGLLNSMDYVGKGLLDKAADARVLSLRMCSGEVMEAHAHLGAGFTASVLQVG